MAVNSIIL